MVKCGGGSMGLCARAAASGISDRRMDSIKTNVIPSVKNADSKKKEHAH